MNMRGTMVCFLVVVFSYNCVDAQTDFFWSFHDLKNGATNSAAFGKFQPGETVSLFLYYSTNGPADSDLNVGAFLDITTSNSGIIGFTDAITFDFKISTGGAPVGSRWLDDKGGGGSAGQTGIVADDLIDEWHAFTVTGGSGIREINNGDGSPLHDSGFDQGADAFLFGRIDFVTLGPGTVDIITSSGDGLIVNDNQIVPATFGNATIIVSVPEPTATCFIAMAVFAISTMRRR